MNEVQTALTSNEISLKLGLTYLTNRHLRGKRALYSVLLVELTGILAIFSLSIPKLHKLMRAYIY